jgi:hypothetical protein
MEKSSQIAWKIVPLRHFFPLKVVPLIEVLLYESLELIASEWQSAFCDGHITKDRKAMGHFEVRRRYIII